MCGNVDGTWTSNDMDDPLEVWGWLNNYDSTGSDLYIGTGFGTPKLLATDSDDTNFTTATWYMFFQEDLHRGMPYNYFRRTLRLNDGDYFMFSWNGFF